MKKLFAVLLTVACVLLAGAALAQSQTSWNQACTKKVIASATAYSWNAETGTLSASGTVPAGSYIKQSSEDEVSRAQGVVRVSWCTADGSTHSGYIYPSVITSATASVTLNNGKSANVPEALLSDTTELYKYLWKNYEAEMRVAPDAGKDVAAAAAKANESGFSVAFTDIEGKLRFVSVRSLGLVSTDIILDNEPCSVSTADLQWTTEAAPECSLGVIFAPRTGKASMYAKKDTNSTVIKKCQAGKIVFVLNKGERYARIWYDGQIGYMPVSTLKFYGPASSDDALTAILSYKGKTNGRAKVNVRQEASAKSRVVCTPVTGTQVDVVALDGTWAQIDVNGYHGYIQTKFIQMLE